MFKPNEIIKLSYKHKNVIYPYELIEVEQSFIVLTIAEPLIEIQGLKDKKIFTINAGYFELDLQLIRKQKLKKICSKLVK